MFTSQTYGKLNIENIPDKLLLFYERMRTYDAPIHVIVGTDSQNHSKTKIVTVIAIVCEGHGGIYFYEISHLDKLDNVRVKLFKETEYSLRVSDTLLETIESDSRFYDLYDNSTFTIHVDAGRSPEGCSRCCRESGTPPSAPCRWDRFSAAAAVPAADSG